MAIGKAPLIGLTLPSKDNSPMMTYFEISYEPVWSVLDNKPIAIGKS